MYLDISNGLQHQDILRYTVRQDYRPSIEPLLPPSLVRNAVG